MACHIHGQRHFHASHRPYLLQVGIYRTLCIHVLATLVRTAPSYYPQQVWRLSLPPPVRYLLHAAFPLHHYLLVRLPSAIRQHPVAQGILPQESHINECHPSGVETEQKHIPCKSQSRPLVQFQGLQSLHLLHPHGTLQGLVHSGIYMPEGHPLRRNLPFHCPVVHSPHYPHVKGTGILSHTPVHQPGLVHTHQVRIHILHGHIALPPEGHETPQCCLVRFCRAHLAHTPQLANHLTHKRAEHIAFSLLYKEFCHIHGTITLHPLIQTSNDIL